MPCKNLSDEREAFETTAFSLTKWTDDVEIVDRRPVLDVAIETVGLLDEDRAAGRLRLQEPEHLAEPAPARLFGRLDVHELLDDHDAVLAGVLPQQLLLGRDREALALLIL